MEVFSSLNLSEFESNPIWKFIVEEAKIRRETIRTELETGITKNVYNIEQKLTYDEIRFLQGEANSIVWLLSLIPVLKEKAKEQEQIKEEDK